MSASDPKTTVGQEADRKALARCAECWDDDEGTDVGKPTLRRLSEVGWLRLVGDDEWEITRKGAQVLQDMGL